MICNYKQRANISLLAFLILRIIQIVDAQQTIGLLNDSPKQLLFGFDELASIQFNNSQESFLEFVISISSNSHQNQFNDFCFFLFMSPMKITRDQYQPDIVYISNRPTAFSIFANKFQVLNADFEGLASGSKALFVDYYQDQMKVQQKLYFYIIGPYLFGTSAPKALNFPDAFQGEFTIKNKMSCLNNCYSNQGQGRCNNYNPQNTFCICEVGFIGRDCGTPAKRIIIDDPAQIIQIPKETKQYVYYEIDSQIYSEGQVLIVEVSFTTDVTGMMITIQQNQETQDYLPDYALWIAQRTNYQVGKEIKKDSQKFQLTIMPANLGSTFVGLFYAADYTQLQFQVYLFSVDSGSNSLIILYIILGALGFIVLVYILYIIRRSKMIRRSNQQIAQNLANQQGVQGQNQGGRGRQQHSQKLTAEQLNEYMPCKSYDKNVKKAHSSEQCAVCLEEFVMNKDLVRVTICQHVFHGECLEEWLKKQQNCPFCRQELTLQKLKEYQKNPIAYQQVQNISVKQGQVNQGHEQAICVQIRNNEGQDQPVDPLVQQNQQERVLNQAQLQ